MLIFKIYEGYPNVPTFTVARLDTIFALTECFIELECVIQAVMITAPEFFTQLVRVPRSLARQLSMFRILIYK